MLGDEPSVIHAEINVVAAIEFTMQCNDRDVRFSFHVVAALFILVPCEGL